MAVPLAGGSSDGNTARGPQCPAGKLCVYAGDKGTGKEVQIGGTGISNKLANEMNNRASSAINDRNKVAFLYTRRDGKGQSFCITAGDSVNLSTFDDVASSSRNSSRNNCPT